MWWPFSWKYKQNERNWRLVEARIEVLRRWRDVGQQFDYLGRRMVVLRHHRIEIIDMWGVQELCLVPELCVRYNDDHGRLHTLVLSEEEALAVAMRQLPSGALDDKIGGSVECGGGSNA